MNSLVRQEDQNDFIETYELIKIAFGRDNEAILVKRLRDSDAFVAELSIVAELDNRIVGHILITKIKIINSHQKEYDSLALAPLAVRPEYQKMGVGTQLVKSGLEKARKLNFRSVIVLGHKLYYPRFGFVPTEKWNIKAPFEVPTNGFMGLELVEGGLKNVSGTVKYPKEFEVV